MIVDLPHTNITRQELGAFEREYLSLLDPAWHGVTHEFRDVEYALAWQNVVLDPDDIVLDVGGACSYFAHFVSGFVKEVHLVDNLTFECGKPWLESMGKLNSTVRFVIQDASVLPFPDETFDVVYSFSVLEHFDENDDIKCVQEIYRVLKKGGIFAGTVDYNAIAERPQGEASLCKAYTLRTFFQRIVLAADFWPTGGVGFDSIPDVVTYDVSPLFFVLSKGVPEGRVLRIENRDW